MPFLSQAATETHNPVPVLDRSVFVFDGNGRLSINRVKISTALSAVAKMRARWVGPDAIQHNDVFDDSKVTFNPRRHFPGEKIVVHAQDALTGKVALDTWYIIDSHNSSSYKVKSKEDLTWPARQTAAAMAQTSSDGLLSQLDRAIIGAVYALGDHPIVYPSVRNIANICRSVDYHINLTDLDLPKLKSVNPKLVDKLKNGYEPKPLEVRIDDGVLTVDKGKCKIIWKFRVVRGLGIVSALKETGIEKACCRLVGNFNDLVIAKLHELCSQGVIKFRYGRPVLTESVSKLVRSKLVDNSAKKCSKEIYD